MGSFLLLEDVLVVELSERRLFKLVLPIEDIAIPFRVSRGPNRDIGHIGRNALMCSAAKASFLNHLVDKKVFIRTGSLLMGATSKIK